MGAACRTCVLGLWAGGWVGGGDGQNLYMVRATNAGHWASPILLPSLLGLSATVGQAVQQGDCLLSLSQDVHCESPLPMSGESPTSESSSKLVARAVLTRGLAPLLNRATGWGGTCRMGRAAGGHSWGHGIACVIL